MAAKSFGDRIADVLLEDGLLMPEQLDEVREQQKQSGGQLLKLLIEKKFVTEEDMMISMGRCLDTPPLNVSKIRVPDEIKALVPGDLAKNYKLVPVAKLANKLFVAMADPLNVLAIDDLRSITKMEIFPMIATQKAVADALSGLTGGGSSVSMDELADQEASETSADVEMVSEKEENVDLDRALSSSQEAPVIKMVNLMLVQAIQEGASDIHLEPYEKKIVLRYRIDGACQEYKSPPKSLGNAISSRVKILSGLDIAERRLPQDGRMRIKVGGKDYDLRVSILPMLYGEKICMRVIDKGNLSASIDKLGLDEPTLKRFMRAVDAPHGMILVTGPTGSGKTTTLYSVLQELNKPQYNITTVEDPVEFNVPGINQCAVRADIGLTFAAALRSILRQDPDIVMIGEIRDGETADIAVKAALTGHQVLSTLHTNDAAGAIARLDDMGIAPFLISSSVILTCAQRLVRRICPHCKEEVEPPPPDYLAKLDLTPEDIEGVTFYEGRGCDRCKGKGYAGRLAVLEVLEVSDRIRKMIIKRANSNDIKKVAVEEGMKTLRMAGFDKVKEGLTTLAEVAAATSEDH
ncbi:ATPase, T2SS/T4P/T4SS family [Oscillatoria amoena NRMC-F 0135]|nr:ATPase, T2SS/T4P/T4SS family [Oscillatoria laete-virens]MDL5047239.1 ATPase, T2SS/T4P/T4SS family [Oscillatoria amoena NRMC-F 0135]MDL5052529.1 ATPase, T2SS/T4P/T4SS family [Oscillatoria laete-virens NRMC-F 0139]